MNPATLTTIRPLLPQKQWAISCGLALALGTLACAQSATTFEAAPQNAPAAKKVVKAAPTENSPAPANIGPSRFVGESNLEAYVGALTAMLSMKSRETDPFGQLQDPDAKPIVKPTIATTTRRTAPLKATPFAEIIGRIQVNTIMPGEQRFLIGTRSFKQGDRFPMKFRGRTLNVEVATVTSREIKFLSLDDGETASLKLRLLPVGMTPGTGGITAPGMVADKPDSPLEIEDFSNATSQN